MGNNRFEVTFVLAAGTLLALALSVGAGPAAADQPAKPEFPVVVPAEPVPAPAAAAPAPAAEEPENKMHWMLMGGIGYRPDYEGSDHYKPHPLASGKLWWDDGRSVSLQSSQSSGAAVRLSTQVVPDSWLKFGPVIQYRLSRGDVQSGRVDAMNNIDGAVEVGAYLGVGEGPWSVGGTYTHDVSGDYHGELVEVAAGWNKAVSDLLDVGVSIASTWAGQGYMETYFNVSPADAAKSGLDQFDAKHDWEDGWKDVGGRLTLGWGPSSWNGWKIITTGAYFRLIGEAADSPVVDDAGDEDQFFGGIGVAYEH